MFFVARRQVVERFYLVPRVGSFFSSSCREQLFYIAHYELARSRQSKSGQSPMGEEPRCCRLSQQENFLVFRLFTASPRVGNLVGNRLVMNSRVEHLLVLGLSDSHPVPESAEVISR